MQHHLLVMHSSIGIAVFWACVPDVMHMGASSIMPRRMQSSLGRAKHGDQQTYSHVSHSSIGAAVFKYLILTPAFIENHIHDNAWEALVMVDHALKLQLKLRLLCKTSTRSLSPQHS